ncbi:MAG: ribosomal protein L7/L12 [Victivallales bacterium]|nr:ribosomal protein L7/L12 [Victivallales bacterium]MBQ6473698.1 ribosomal protein L7/L12 [Victivallales bacterium]
MATEFNVTLISIGTKFLSIAKAIAKATGRAQEEILNGLEELPVLIGEGMPSKAANTLKAQLESLGGEVELEELVPAAVTLRVLEVGKRAMSVGKLIAKATGRDLMELLEAMEELPYVIEGLEATTAAMLKQQCEALGASVELLEGGGKEKSGRANSTSGVSSEPAKSASAKEPESSAGGTPATSASSSVTAPQNPPIPKRPKPTSDSTLTSKFEENWQLLEDEAERIKQEKLLPFRFTDIDGTVAERTAEDLDVQMDSLKKEKFTISVCGMVKAGKSTFLNALLFGEDILPAFDTPMTAKLNFIEYSEEKNHFIVNFYDNQEWKDLLGGLDKENLSQLNERIQLCAERHGIDQDECIGAPPRKEMDLRKLEEFVSDPKSKKGKYTPFVKDVHIFVHNESIKDVRIVDTPGLNDPNVINSRETTKWIKNTHALIFLLPNKGLDESSLKFFDTHLLGTRPSNRVWVINKIDDISEDDLQKTKAYIRQLGQQEEFKQKDLFGPEERVCGYSALVAMLRNMYKKGANLNEDQMYHLDNVGDDFQPDPDKLGEVIGERLYQNTGVKRIVAGFTAIDTVYSQHIKIAEKTILNCEMVIDDGKKSDQELKEEVRILTESQASFKNRLNGWKNDLHSVVFDAFRTEVAEKASKMVDGLSRKMQMRVDSCISADQLKGLSFEYRDECNKLFNYYGALATGLNDCAMTLRGELEITVKKIRNLFAQNEIEGNVDFAPLENLNTLELSVDDLIDEADYRIADQLPSNWFTELFHSKEAMRTTARNAFQEMISKIREELDSGVQDLQSGVEKQIANSFAEFQNSIENSILQKRAYLESGSAERQKALEKAQQELEAAQALKERVGELQRAFKYQFPQEITMNA